MIAKEISMPTECGRGPSSVGNGKEGKDRFSFVMITQDDPLYVREFFEEFLAHYRPLEDLKLVVVAPTLGKRSLRILVRQMYDFYGPFDFVRMGLRFLRLRLLERISGGSLFCRSFSIEGACRARGVQVEKWGDINSAEALATLQGVAPDLIVSVAAPQIFKKSLIALAPLGSLNIHNSPLPKYRGMMPNFWQMLNGEQEVGTTIHFINEGIDDGAIILQFMTPILPEESLDSLIRRTKRLGARMMVEAIGSVRSGRETRLPNAGTEATYFSFPSREDVRRFRKKGYRLL